MTWFIFANIVKEPFNKKGKKRKSFSKITLLNSSATTSCNATSPLTIPCRHHLIPLSFLPPSLQSLFTSLSAYFTDKGISFLPLSSALRRAHERYSVCVGGGGGGDFFSFHFSFRHVQSALLLFFFYSVVRFRCCEVAFFPLFILLLQFRRRQSERISHNDVDCSRQLTIEASARD